MNTKGMISILISVLLLVLILPFIVDNLNGDDLKYSSVYTFTLESPTYSEDVDLNYLSSYINYFNNRGDVLTYQIQIGNDIYLLNTVISSRVHNTFNDTVYYVYTMDYMGGDIIDLFYIDLGNNEFEIYKSITTTTNVTFTVIFKE